MTASADEHADLFWALRGGGGNFGVVTALEFRLHPVARVYAGTAYFAVDRAAETLALYREWIADAPDAMSTAVLLTRLPEGERVLAIRAMHAGEADEAQRLLAPLFAAAGPPLVDGMRPMPFADAAMGGTAPRHVELLDALPDAVIELAGGGRRPVSTVEVRHWGGAMARPGADAGPVGHRDVPLSVILDERVPAVAAALAPHATGGSFLNFLADPALTETAYTPCQPRGPARGEGELRPGQPLQRRPQHRAGRLRGRSGGVDRSVVVAHHPRGRELRARWCAARRASAPATPAAGRARRGRRTPGRPRRGAGAGAPRRRGRPGRRGRRRRRPTAPSRCGRRSPRPTSRRGR